jgi:hypothetical protein
MLQLALLAWIAVAARDIREIEESLLIELSRVEEQLVQLRKLRQELALANPIDGNYGSANVQHPSKPADLMLIGVDVSRTREELNAKALFTRDGGASFPTSFVAAGMAPILTFRSLVPSIARRLWFRSIAAVDCSLRQFRLHFEFESEHVYSTRVIDLPNKTITTEVDLEIDVIYDLVRFDVFRNLGDETKTCLNRFEFV